MEVVKGFVEVVSRVLMICAVVAAVYFVAKWLLLWEPTLFVILMAIFVLLLVSANS